MSFVSHTGACRAHVRTHRRWPDRGLLPLAGNFFLESAHWIGGPGPVYLHLPDYRATNTQPLDIVGLILFGLWRCPPFLCS